MCKRIDGAGDGTYGGHTADDEHPSRPFTRSALLPPLLHTGALKMFDKGTGKVTAGLKRFM